MREVLKMKDGVLSQIDNAIDNKTTRIGSDSIESVRESLLEELKVAMNQLKGTKYSMVVKDPRYVSKHESSSLYTLEWNAESEVFERLMKRMFFETKEDEDVARVLPSFYGRFS